MQQQQSKLVRCVAKATLMPYITWPSLTVINPNDQQDGHSSVRMINLLISSAFVGLTAATTVRKAGLATSEGGSTSITAGTRHGDAVSQICCWQHSIHISFFHSLGRAATICMSARRRKRVHDGRQNGVGSLCVSMPIRGQQVCCTSHCYPAGWLVKVCAPVVRARNHAQTRY